MAGSLEQEFHSSSVVAVQSRQTLLETILRLPILLPIFNALRNARLIENTAAVLFAAAVSVVALYAVLKPDYNWDMVAYVGTALERQYPDAQDLHRETWQRIDEGASERQEYHLKLSNPYNLHQWKNPADFQSQLSMYRVKIGYIAALRMLDPLVGVVNASFLLSVVPSLLFGALCLWWMWREKALQGALLFFPLLILIDYLPLTTVVTPDMLASAVSMAGIYAFYRRHDWLGAAFLVLAVSIRPDSFVLVIALTIAASLFGWRKLPIIAAFGASLLLTLVASKLAGHPGWWPHFYFSNIQLQNSMTGFHPDFSFYDLGRGYVRGIVVTFQHNDWLAMLVALSGFWALLAKAGKMINPRANALAFAMVIGTLGKFASFPLPDDRFYFVFIAAFGLLLITSWRPQYQLDMA
jgi:hypothetical protein